MSQRNNLKETDQEKQMRMFLFDNNIAYEQHKRILGDGDKVWIIDFYLPESGIIIEAKELNWMRRDSKGYGNDFGAAGMGGIYKDLYKMWELNHRYSLIGILYLKVPMFIFPKSFIPNLNAHHIYCIQEPIQVLSILQKQTVECVNRDFQPKLKSPPPDKTSFNDPDCMLLWDWASGKSFKELGLHAMTLHRKLKRFVHTELENKKLDATNDATSHQEPL